MKALARALPGALVAVALGLAAAPQAAHAQLGWTATFGPEATGATGSGGALILLNTSTNLLSIKSWWSGLSGNTTVAHIHCCTAVPGAGTIGVAVTPTTLPGFPAGTTSGQYQANIDLNLSGSFTTAFRNNFGGGTQAGAIAALVNGMNAGTAYFNIHTNNYPSGEIRGFTTVVPEPSTYALMAGGLAGLALVRRRRRR